MASEQADEVQGPCLTQLPCHEEVRQSDFDFHGTTGESFSLLTGAETPTPSRPKWIALVGGGVGATLILTLLLVLGSSPPVSPTVEPSPRCSGAKVAVCITGNRFLNRDAFNLNQEFMKSVIQPLGGVNNVDVYISSDPEVVGSPPYRTLLGLLHNGTEALNTRSKITQPGSLGFGTFRLPTAQDLASGNCSQASGLNVSVYSPLFMFSTYVQQFRQDQCMRRVLDHEALCKRRYDWVVRERSDAYYGPHPGKQHIGSILADNKTILDLVPKVYVYCKRWTFGTW
eukprot:TRINITY_DN9970_c0_g3_i5.p1 TRINITY_DN9970_c0_g3~~TRINITY_DN9970_c0_g3_i5.p1  ORF type:complete len:285 (-),score=9.73 TRINITY_DN9970_c0_g3_i5:100-954(-)